eukprot:gene3453-6102_t
MVLSVSNKVLPDEILYHIFFFLPINDINKFERVSKQWKELYPSEKKKKNGKKKEGKDLWEIISSEQFTHQFMRRKTYPSKIDTHRFCIYQFRSYLVNETKYCERILRSLEYEFEKERSFSDVCVVHPHLFHQYIQIFKIDKYYDEMELFDHYFSIYGLNLKNYNFKSYENDKKLKIEKRMKRC